MTNELKKIYLPIIICENDVNEFLKYFDFFEEYNNDKPYITCSYEYDYGFGLRKYSNAIFIFDVEIKNSSKKNILLNKKYVVAREIFNQIELALLEKYCPCSKCLTLNVSKSLPIHQDIFIRYCIGKYKTKFIALPLVQEARKLKNICEKN